MVVCRNFGAPGSRLRHPPATITNPTAADRQIPTVLSYVNGDEYYGAQAKAFLVRNPDNTIAYFRDFLGKEYV